MKDGYTADHCRRLQRLGCATGQQLGLSQAELYRLDFGSLLHDVGKVKVPVDILQKPGKLTPEEWNMYQAASHDWVVRSLTLQLL